MGNIERHNLEPSAVEADIEVMLWSMSLHGIYRYFHQRYWDKETIAAEYSKLIDPHPALESVSAHSWHVSDSVLLLAPHFPDLDITRCLQLAILHDKMEIFTSDLSPIGRDGTGNSTHAFNPDKQTQKYMKESHAISQYISMLRPDVVEQQQSLLDDAASNASREARFVKVVDRLQSLVYVILKKKGDMTIQHLDFTLKYSQRTLTYFPELSQHYSCLRDILLSSVAACRSQTIQDIRTALGDFQTNLFEDDI